MRKILRFIAYSLIVFTLSSCAKEVLHPEQMIEGEFAFDDGTGFCDEYISFNKGILTTYVSQDRVVLKDGYLWNASFVEKSADKYSIVNDKLYVNSKDRGSISYLDMLVWDTKIYTRVKGFKNEEESIYYYENGKKLGKAIAVVGNWDGNSSTPNTVLYWAPVNCGYEEKGTVNTDSDHRLGKLYQWGAGDPSLPYKYNGSPVVAREMYYDTATPSPWYNKDVIDGTTSDKWNNNQGPCPDGWRLPTSQEFEVLCAGKNGDYGWVSAGTYAGQSNTYSGAEFFGANADKTVGKGVFFPAAGDRYYDDGSAYCRGSDGYYWSSTPDLYLSYDAYNLCFDSSHLIPQDYRYRAFAFSVRCVSGEGDPQGKVIIPAIVATIAVRDVTNNSAICEGKVTSEGDGAVTERGFCYSTYPMPTVMDTKVKAATYGLGSFTCDLTDLAEKTTYYVRAYAVNAYGTYYGNVMTFTTLEDVRPNYIEGGKNLGKGISILGDWNADGNQTTLYWAPVNCGYEEKGTANTDSDHRLGKLYQWGAGDSSLPYYYNGTKVVAREMYYDTATPSPWYSSSTIVGTTSDKWNNNQGPCPDGWRLPTSLEFEVLCAGKNGEFGWVDKGTYAGQSNTYAGAEFFGANTDKTVGKGVFFPAAGYRYFNNGFAYYRGSYGFYWSSTPFPNSSSHAYLLDFSSSYLSPQYDYYRAYAFSVRCVSGEGDPQGKVIIPAIVATIAVRDVTNNSAICEGKVTSEGDGAVTERGVCYSTYPMPTVMDTKVKAATYGLGSFTCDLTDLAEKTTYYVRAYAVNAYGTYYGNVMTFTTLEDVRPNYIEGGKNLGKGISILGDWNEDGTQTTLYWAPVNCGYEEKGTVNTYSDHRLGKLYQWGAGDASLPYKYNGSPVVAREMYCDTATPSPWYDDNTIDGTTSDKWNNNQGPCPEGWRLPTSLEFKVLCAGKNGSYGWDDKGTYAGQSNTYAGAEFFGANSDKTVGKGVFFPAAGCRGDGDGNAYGRGSYGFYWSSTPYPDYSDGAYFLYFLSSFLNPQNYFNRAGAFSVRCVSE